MKNATSEIISIVENAVLEVNYLQKNKSVVYSIADFIGNIVQRGNFNEGKNKRLDIQSIPKGMYTLFIIDGDCLTKVRFNKN